MSGETKSGGAGAGAGAAGAGAASSSSSSTGTRERVMVYLYDLSHGMAKTMSPGLLGKTIDGIWHTAIVVYGYEYFYGGGIVAELPAQTAAGHPQQVIDMGETTVPQELFHEFLSGASPRFTAETYSLLTHNCNNFTDECSKFLVGKPIPSFITGLPEEALNTPMGMMFRPMIENMERGMRQSRGGGGMVPWGGGGLQLPAIRKLGGWRPHALPATMIADAAPASSGTESKRGAASATGAGAPSATPTTPTATATATPAPAASSAPSLISAQSIAISSSDSKYKSYETLVKLGSKKQDEKLQLSTTDIEQLGYVVTLLAAGGSAAMPAPAFALFDRLLQWSPSGMFPVLGLFRSFVLRPEVARQYASDTKYLDRVLATLPSEDKKSDAPESAQMMALGTLANLLSHSSTSPALSKDERVLQVATTSLHSTNTGVRFLGAAVCFNLSLVLPKTDSDAVVGAVSTLIDRCSKEVDAATCERLLLALGHFALGNSSLTLLLPALDFNPTPIIGRFPASVAAHATIHSLIRELAIMIVAEQRAVASAP